LNTPAEQDRIGKTRTPGACGKTAVGALNNYDIPTVQGVIVFATIAIIIFNLVVDLLYAWVDPRIRLA